MLFSLVIALFNYLNLFRSWLPRGLRRRSSALCLHGLRVRIPLTALIFVSYVYTLCCNTFIKNNQEILNFSKHKVLWGRKDMAFVRWATPLSENQRSHRKTLDYFASEFCKPLLKFDDTVPNMVPVSAIKDWRSIHRSTPGSSLSQ
jgi:hypothetical protein